LTEIGFHFVGYLVQEPYLKNWPQREGLQVATIERDVHPDLQREWKEIGGFLNATEFRTTLPRVPEAGWVLNGYSIEPDAIETVLWYKTDKPEKTFLYALHTQRANDELLVIGYELVDCAIERLSILNNCGYSLDEIHRVAGELNRYGLFDSSGQAKEFQKYVASRNYTHNCSAVFEVLGRPLS